MNCLFCHSRLIEGILSPYRDQAGCMICNVRYAMNAVYNEKRDIHSLFTSNKNINMIRVALISKDGNDGIFLSLNHDGECLEETFLVLDKKRVLTIPGLHWIFPQTLSYWINRFKELLPVS